MTMGIKLQRTALQCIKNYVKTLHPGEIRTHDHKFRGTIFL
jgi:hypothetical protein